MEEDEEKSEWKTKNNVKLNFEWFIKCSTEELFFRSIQENWHRELFLQVIRVKQAMNIEKIANNMSNREGQK